jgi:putative DNA methylase
MPLHSCAKVSGLAPQAAKGRGGRVYLSPTPKQEAAGTLNYEVDVTSFDIEMPVNPRWFSPPSHGMKTFASLFTQRQLLALTTFSELVAEVREQVLIDAQNAGLGKDGQMLQDGGAGPVAYADAVATYLAFCVSRAADYGSTISTWLTDDNAIRGTFGRQAVPMTWDFCEGNPFGESSAALAKILTTIPDVIAHQRATGFAKVMQTDAGKNGYTAGPFVINTDPPYYDNIGYADLSDFFYMWLRKSLASVWPDILRRLATPKDAELVATPYRHNGRAEAETFFLEGMGTALRAIGVAATDEQPIVIYYAFKQTESANDGITSAGWATFLQGIIASGLMVDGTWPLRTESGGRLIGRGANALASSIVLVCRKRQVDAPSIARAEFLRALKREMPEAIDAIRKAGVVPVDMEQAVLGPGMGVFSRNERVLEDDDTSMTVKTALGLINRIWQEIENELDTTFDPETQVALAWYDSYGFDARSSGELIMLTTAKNTSDRALFQSCVFQDKKGKTALTPRAALSSSWSPGKDSHLTVWMCVQQVARVLVAENGGTEAAARLIAEMGSTSADARKLAYRLFELATKKSWSAEALVYNELAEVWPKLEDLAIEMARRVPAPAVSSPQADLFGMEA